MKYLNSISTYAWGVVSTSRRSKDQLVPIRCIRFSKRLESVSTAVFDIRQSRRKILRLLTAKVRLLSSSVNVGVCCAFEVGMFGEDEVEELVIEFVVKIDEDWME